MKNMSNEYITLLEDCQAIKIERGYNSRVELINEKWDLGKVIYFAKEVNKKIYGENIILKLASDLQISASSIWSYINFYQKYPFNSFSNVLEELPDGKNISWYKISRLLSGKIDEEKYKRKKFTLSEIELSFKKWANTNMDEAQIDLELESFKNILCNKINLK